MLVDIKTLFTNCKKYTPDYFYRLMSILFTKTNNYKIIEAFTYIQMYYEDNTIYHTVFPKISEIYLENKNALFEDTVRFDENSESSYSSITNSNGSNTCSNTCSITNSEITSSESEFEEYSRQYKTPDYTWKFKTKELNIHYIPDSLQGISLCFTGNLDSFGRDEVIQWCQNLGGTAKNYMTKDVDYLVVGNDPGNTKLDFAKKWNVPLLYETEFIGMLISATNEKLEYQNTLPFNNELSSKVLEFQLKKSNIEGISVCLDLPNENVNLKNELNTEINSGYQLI